MAEKNVKINVKTSTGYDTLYPQTKGEIVIYDNSNSGLDAVNINQAIDELKEKTIDKTLESLDEVSVATEKGYYVDALAIKDFYQKNGFTLETLSNTNDNKRFVEKYENGFFKAWGYVKIDTDIDYTQIGSTGIYYGTYVNLVIGITPTEVLSTNTSVYNTGVVWCDKPQCAGDRLSGIIFQIGASQRNTYINYYIIGKYK